MGSVPPNFVFFCFWGKLHRLGNLGQRQVDADFAEGQNGIHTGVDLPDEAALGATEDHRRRGLLFDQDVDVERRNGQVGVFIFALVDAPGPPREDLNEHGRVVLEGIGLRGGPANDRGVPCRFVERLSRLTNSEKSRK